MTFYALTFVRPLDTKGPGRCQCIKNMFDSYYCIRSFCSLKTLEKRLENLNVCSIIISEKHERCVGFRDASSESTNMRHSDVTKQASRFVCVLENYFLYFLSKTYVVGIQKNRLGEAVLLSTQNTCLN